MKNTALQSLLHFAGWSPDHANGVEFIGDLDPQLPTSFKVTETGTATLAALGLAVSDLWEQRNGRRQDVRIDTRHATASLRSTNYFGCKQH